MPIFDEHGIYSRGALSEEVDARITIGVTYYERPASLARLWDEGCVVVETTDECEEGSGSGSGSGEGDGPDLSFELMVGCCGESTTADNDCESSGSGESGSGESGSGESSGGESSGSGGGSE